MIKLHHIFRLVFGFAMVEFCRFFYFQQQYRGPSYELHRPSAPSLSAEQQKLLNVTPSSQYPGFYQIGNQNLYLSGNKVYQQDQSGTTYIQPLGTNTRFKRYSGDIKGFISEGDDAKTYSPSMAYISALQSAQNPYVPFSAPQAPINVLGYNPSSLISSIYTPASASTTYTPTGTSYGAGRYLSGSGLLGKPISFTPSSTTSNVSTP